jgi:very-short-patch-repair endonuclease
MPQAEEMFWREVRGGRLHGSKWKRQVPVTPYVVDFVCPAARIVLELDGPPHETPERRARDSARDAWLRAQGFTVMRFPNDLVIGGLPIVTKEVLAALRSRHGPSPCPPAAGCPSPAKGGGRARHA